MTNTHVPGWPPQQADSDAPPRRSHLGREEFVRPGPRRWKRQHTVIAAALALLLTAGGTAGAWWNAEVEADLADAQSRASAAREDLDAAYNATLVSLGAAAETTGVPNVVTSDGAVVSSGADLLDQVLGGNDLATAYNQAVDQHHAHDLFILIQTRAETLRDERGESAADTVAWSGRTAHTKDLLDYVSEADELTTGLVGSTVALDESVAAWQLAQASAALETARAELDAALASARTTLDGSAERVLDDSSRWALTDAIIAAQAVRDEAVNGEDVDAMIQAAADLGAQVAPLDAAVGAVTAAVEAWQADKDAHAADSSTTTTTTPKADTTTPAKTPTTTPKKTGSGTGSGTGSSTTTPPTTSGSESGGGSTWVESGPDTWCFQGDTSGAEGTGGWC